MVDEPVETFDDDRGSTRGFTIVELLVVVLIIGVLAAISIPVYLGVQSKATETSAKSDLTNAKIAINAFHTTHGAYPAAIDAITLAEFGYSATSVIDVSVGTPSIESFCLAVDTSGAGVWFITDALSPTSTKPSGCS